MRKCIFCLIFCILYIHIGCAPTIKLFPDAAEPLKEFTLSGTGKKKVLLVPIRGILSDEPRRRMFDKPSMVQEIVSQLRLAEKDENIKAVVMKINSPGGSVTASDIIYHEVMRYRSKSGAKVIAALMNLAASGGYYISLPADHIMAHPTTVTGSVGVIMLMPKIQGLMSKIGVEIDVRKYGRNKDMASPFRQATDEEQQLLQKVADNLGSRFVELVKKHRKLEREKLNQVTTARIFVADEARAAGLVDEVGYLSDALSKAKKIARLPKNSRVVVYRRNEYANDNIYNTATVQAEGFNFSLIDLNLSNMLSRFDTGFYYLWLPGAGSY